MRIFACDVRVTLNLPLTCRVALGRRLVSFPADTFYEVVLNFDISNIQQLLTRFTQLQNFNKTLTFGLLTPINTRVLILKINKKKKRKVNVL